MFNKFQTATATLKKIGVDGSGDETVLESFSVDIDPVFGWKRTYSKTGTQFTGMSTVITPKSNFDVHYDNWKMDYEGKTYQIETLVPFYSIGGNVLTHIEVVFR